MSEPKRLRDGHGPAGMLLGSARDDGPSAESFERAAKRLGLVGAVIGASTLGASGAAAATASTGAASGTGATVGAGLGATVATGGGGIGALGATTSALTGAAGTTAAGVAGLSLFTKVAALAVVGVALATGTVIATRAEGTALESPKTASAPTSQTPPTEPARAILPVVPAPIEPSAPAGEPLTVVESKEAPKPEKTSAKPAPSSDTGLRDEVALLDAARAANARGDTAQALAVLGQHAQRFPQGFLRSEAAVLRVEALVKAGRQAEARSEGERLLAREPNGPQAQRVRSLLEHRTVR